MQQPRARREQAADPRALGRAPASARERHRGAGAGGAEGSVRGLVGVRKIRAQHARWVKSTSFTKNFAVAEPLPKFALSQRRCAYVFALM